MKKIDTRRSHDHHGWQEWSNLKPASSLDKISVDASVWSCHISLGRCSSCDFEYRQLTTDGVNRFVCRSRKLELAGETNRRSASSGARPEDWSLLLAAALSWASIQGVPKGSGQGSRAAATIIILQSLHRPRSVSSRLQGREQSHVVDLPTLPL